MCFAPFARTKVLYFTLLIKIALAFALTSFWNTWTIHHKTYVETPPPPPFHSSVHNNDPFTLLFNHGWNNVHVAQFVLPALKITPRRAHHLRYLRMIVLHDPPLLCPYTFWMVMCEKRKTHVEVIIMSPRQHGVFLFTLHLGAIF